MDLYVLASYLFIPIITAFLMYCNEAFFTSIKHSKLDIKNKTAEFIFRYLTLVVLIMCTFNLYFLIYKLDVYMRLFYASMIAGMVLIYYWIKHAYDKHKKSKNKNRRQS